MQLRTSSFGAMLSALTSVMGSGVDAGSDTDGQLQPRRQRRRLPLPRPADVAVLDRCRLGPHRWGRLLLPMPSDLTAWGRCSLGPPRWGRPLLLTPPDVADAAWTPQMQWSAC